MTSTTRVSTAKDSKPLVAVRGSSMLRGKAQADDPITIGSRACSREDAPGRLGKELDALPLTVRETRRVPLGTFRGLRFGLVLHPHFGPDVYLEGHATRQSGFLREHQGPRAVLNAVERLANGYGSECDRVRKDLGIAQSQLRDYQARLGKPFPHDAYLTELTTLRDTLRDDLSGTAAESCLEPRDAVSELAARIKVLTATNTLESTPERRATRLSSAETPVTVRLCRRKETAHTSSSAIESVSIE